MVVRTKELKAKPTPELERMLTQGRESVRDLRFRIAAKQQKDVREIREAKRLVAQILTLLNDRRRSNKSSSKT